MKTILTTAYAINPYKGSEDGMGWNHILQIAKYSNVIAITRKNNLPAIEKYISENNLTDLKVKFYGYDLPYWMRFWKRGQNGAMAYYYLWQFFMPIFILLKQFQFDIAHNLNFHTDWIPTFLWVFRKPVIWGPIGHHPKVPTNYYHQENTSWVDRLKNHVIWITKKVFWNLDPFFYLAKLNVNTILCFSEEVAHQMKANLNKVQYMYSVGSEQIPYERKAKLKFKILSVGRLVPLKGFDITIRSFHHFLKGLKPDERQNVELVIVGKGKMLAVLQDYVKKKRPFRTY
jgi:glycosyltransferase involved in cell wall biosynthesis